MDVTTENGKFQLMSFRLDELTLRILLPEIETAHSRMHTNKVGCFIVFFVTKNELFEAGTLTTRSTQCKWFGTLCCGSYIVVELTQIHVESRFVYSRSNMFRDCLCFYVMEATQILYAAYATSVVYCSSVYSAYAVRRMLWIALLVESPYLSYMISKNTYDLLINICSRKNKQIRTEFITTFHWREFR